MSDVLRLVPWIVFVLAIAWIFRPQAVTRHRNYVSRLEQLERAREIGGTGGVDERR